MLLPIFAALTVSKAFLIEFLFKMVEFAKPVVSSDTILIPKPLLISKLEFLSLPSSKINDSLGVCSKKSSPSSDSWRPFSINSATSFLSISSKIFCINNIPRKLLKDFNNKIFHLV